MKDSQSSPVANFSVEGFCEGDTIWFTDLSTISGGILKFIYWDFGDGIDTYSEPGDVIYHIYQSSRTFNVKIRAIADDESYDESDVKSLEIRPKPSVELSYSTDPANVSEGQSLKITATGDYANAYWSRNGDDVGEGESILVQTSGYYDVRVVLDECESTTRSDSVQVKSSSSTVESGVEIKLLSNLLTPNGDGINETLYIVGLSDFENDCVVSIYNVRGKKVYESMNYDNSWTAGDVGAGTYYYHIHSSGYKGITGYIDVIK